MSKREKEEEMGETSVRKGGNGEEMERKREVEKI